MKTKLITTLAFLTLVIVLSIFNGCTSRLEEKRIDNVVRIFWHEHTRYSVQIREPNSKEIKTVTLHPLMCDYRKYPILIADVPRENPMWVRYILKQEWENNCLQLLEIHIHSENDIEGGGWNHGKFGSGQTSVVR